MKPNKPIVALLLSVFLLPGCAANKPLTRTSFPDQSKAYVIVQGCGPIQYTYVSAASATGVLFGALGGAIGGAIDGTIGAAKQKQLMEKVGEWSVCDFFTKNLEASLQASLGRNAFSRDPAAQDADVKKMLILTKPKPSSSDRWQERQDRKEYQSNIDAATAWLEKNGFTHLMTIKLEYVGMLESAGRLNYKVAAVGSLYDIHKPGQTLWKRYAESNRDLSVPEERLTFESELQKEPEVIRQTFIARAGDVVRSFSNDFKSE